MQTLRPSLLFIAMALTALVSIDASSKNYPTKPIRIVTSDPGGGTDFTARIVGRGISDAMGQTVVIDSRGGTIAPEIVSQATPDGYTVLVASSGFWIGPLLGKVAYDPIKNFAAISLLVNSPNILVVHPSVPAKSVKELIDLAKEKPGTLNYSSSIRGSSGYLAAELFKMMANIKIEQISYKGTGAALVGLVSGEVQLSFSTSAPLVPHIKFGKLRPLAVTTLKQSLIAPDLPTVAATLPGYDTGGLTAMFAPRGTSSAVISRLNREVLTFLNQPSVKERFLGFGVEVVASSPDELAAKLKDDMAKWVKVFKVGPL